MPIPNPQYTDLLFAEIEATADGDNEIVGAVVGKRIMVVGYALMGTGVGTLAFKLSGSRNARVRVGADGGGAAFAGNLECPAFGTDAGSALIVTNPAGVDSYGHVTYYLED
jgi:predicted cobalt transporter CbtA